MASIQYLSNGVTCCIPVTDTQTTHPALAYYDSNGCQKFVALTTASLSGHPHLINNGTDYSVGVAPAVGGVQIYSDNICIACAYNYNTTIFYEVCDGTNLRCFSLGICPTFTSGTEATVSFNSKNTTGASLCIDDFFDCMISRSTGTGWTLTKTTWDNANANVALGCANSYVKYCICLNDNCYWSCSSSFCETTFATNGVSCIPPKCWSEVDYASYDLNRTSGTMYVAGSDYLGDYTWTGGITCCYIDYGDYDEYHTCGYRVCLTTPPKRYHVWGSVPSAVTFCSPASAYVHPNVTQVTSANSWTYSSGDQYYLGSTGYNERRTSSTWTFDCTSYNYYPDINCVCLCVYCVYNAEATACVIGGRWSDGSTGWTTSYGRAITEAYSGGTCQPINCACLITRTNLGTSSKSWQNFMPPTLVHCAW